MKRFELFRRFFKYTKFCEDVILVNLFKWLFRDEVPRLSYVTQMEWTLTDVLPFPHKLTQEILIFYLVSPAFKAFDTTSRSLSSATNTSVLPVSKSYIKESHKLYKRKICKHQCPMFPQNKMLLNH